GYLSITIRIPAAIASMARRLPLPERLKAGTRTNAPWTASTLPTVIPSRRWLRCRPRYRFRRCCRRLGFGLSLGRFIGHDQGGHLLPVHRRRPFPLAGVGQLLQDGVQHPPPLLLVLHLAAPEQDGDLDLVVVFEELACLHDLGFHVVVARL